MFKDYYDILGVPCTSTGRDIRAAYKKLALQFHPDKTMGTTGLATAHHVHDELDSIDYDTTPLLASTVNRNQALERDILFGGTSSLVRRDAETDTTAQFTELQEAYEVLSDVARRYLYDLSYNELLTQQRLLREELEQQRRAYLERQEAREAQAAAERAQARERERQRLVEQQARLDATSTALQNLSAAFSLLQSKTLGRPEASEATAAEKPTDAARPTQEGGSTSHVPPAATRTRVPTPPPKRPGNAGVDHAANDNLASASGSPLAPASSSRADTTAKSNTAASQSSGLTVPPLSERTEAYYYQRSIQRTMEVFFSKELEAARSSLQ